MRDHDGGYKGRGRGYREATARGNKQSFLVTNQSFRGVKNRTITEQSYRGNEQKFEDGDSYRRNSSRDYDIDRSEYERNYKKKENNTHESFDDYARYNQRMYNRENDVVNSYDYERNYDLENSNSSNSSKFLKRNSNRIDRGQHDPVDHEYRDIETKKYKLDYDNAFSVYRDNERKDDLRDKIRTRCSEPEYAVVKDSIRTRYPETQYPVSQGNIKSRYSEPEYAVDTRNLRASHDIRRPYKENMYFSSEDKISEEISASRRHDNFIITVENELARSQRESRFKYKSPLNDQRDRYTPELSDCVQYKDGELQIDYNHSTRISEHSVRTLPRNQFCYNREPIRSCYINEKPDENLFESSCNSDRLDENRIFDYYNEDLNINLSSNTYKSHSDFSQSPYDKNNCDAKVFPSSYNNEEHDKIQSRDSYNTSRYNFNRGAHPRSEYTAKVSSYSHHAVVSPVEKQSSVAARSSNTIYESYEDVNNPNVVRKEGIYRDRYNQSSSYTHSTDFVTCEATQSNSSHSKINEDNADPPYRVDPRLEVEHKRSLNINDIQQILDVVQHFTGMDEINKAFPEDKPNKQQELSTISHFKNPRSNVEKLPPNSKEDCVDEELLRSKEDLKKMGFNELRSHRQKNKSLNLRRQDEFVRKDKIITSELINLTNFSNVDGSPTRDIGDRPRSNTNKKYMDGIDKIVAEERHKQPIRRSGYRNFNINSVPSKSRDSSNEIKSSFNESSSDQHPSDTKQRPRTSIEAMLMEAADKAVATSLPQINPFISYPMVPQFVPLQPYFIPNAEPAKHSEKSPRSYSRESDNVKNEILKSKTKLQQSSQESRESIRNEHESPIRLSSNERKLAIEHKRPGKHKWSSDRRRSGGRRRSSERISRHVNPIEKAIIEAEERANKKIRHEGIESAILEAAERIKNKETKESVKPVIIEIMDDKVGKPVKRNFPPWYDDESREMYLKRKKLGHSLERIKGSKEERHKKREASIKTQLKRINGSLSRKLKKLKSEYETCKNVLSSIVDNVEKFVHKDEVKLLNFIKKDYNVELPFGNASVLTIE